jgi:hypothetical protein
MHWYYWLPILYVVGICLFFGVRIYFLDIYWEEIRSFDHPSKEEIVCQSIFWIFCLPFVTIPVLVSSLREQRLQRIELSRIRIAEHKRLIREAEEELAKDEVEYRKDKISL